MLSFDERYKEYTVAVDAALDGAVPSEAAPMERLAEAMRYSLLAPGKRLRPVLLLEFCRVCGGDWRDALPFAAAIEMVHVYSMIHDDLPCMDDDDVRRGQPSCHKVFGEATALLAGSALLSRAFEVMLGPTRLPDGRALRAAGAVARASGMYGIAGGQELDLNTREGTELDTVHTLKTAAMFIAAAQTGCIAAGAREELENAAAGFGKYFGLGFQYADDCADADGGEDSRQKALAFYNKALTCLDCFEDASFQRTLTERLSAVVEGGVV